MTETEFDDLHTQLAQPLLGYLLRRTASPEDAADLLAEAMTIVWTQRRALPPEAERRPWLFGIARNLLAQHRRQRTRERLQPHLEPPPGLSTPDRVMPSVT